VCLKNVAKNMLAIEDPLSNQDPKILEALTQHLNTNNNIMKNENQLHCFSFHFVTVKTSSHNTGYKKNKLSIQRKVKIFVLYADGILFFYDEREKFAFFMNR
jgi:hypothetical protein